MRMYIQPGNNDANGWEAASEEKQNTMQIVLKQCD